MRRLMKPKTGAVVSTISAQSAAILAPSDPPPAPPPSKLVIRRPCMIMSTPLCPVPSPPLPCADTCHNQCVAIMSLGPASPGNVSGGASKSSTDNCLAFGARSGSGGGGGVGEAVSSDWLMAGETARAGMISSVTAENSGRPGPLVVDDGVFQARLLCPSKVCASGSLACYMLAAACVFCFRLEDMRKR